MASKTILLVCNAGMSSSFLVSKMQQTIDEKDLDISITAVSASEVEGKLKTQKIDFLLLSPQVRYLKPSFEKCSEGKQLIISVIDNTNYARMNTDKIVDDLL